jgi:hypothetical protein
MAFRVCEVFGLVVAQVVADGEIGVLLVEVLTRDQVGGHQIVVAPFAGAEYGVEHTGHQFNSADDEPVYVAIL